MWQRFTERTRRVIFFAQEEASRLGENFVGTEHLLLGLVREVDSVAARILQRQGATPAAIQKATRQRIRQDVGRGNGRPGGEMQLTPRCKRVIDLAYAEARMLHNNYIGTEHLLLGLLAEAEALGGVVLREFGLDLHRMRAEVIALQDGSPAPEAEPRAPLRSLLQIQKEDGSIVEVRTDDLHSMRLTGPFGEVEGTLVGIRSAPRDDRGPDAAGTLYTGISRIARGALRRLKRPRA